MCLGTNHLFFFSRFAFFSDKQLTARQSSFCTFRPVNVLICTWNIDSAKPTDLNGSAANAHFLEDVLRSVDSPDIIVFGFQEVIPLTDKKYTASMSPSLSIIPSPLFLIVNRWNNPLIINHFEHI